MLKLVDRIRWGLPELKQAIRNLGPFHAVDYLFLKRERTMESVQSGRYTLGSRHARFPLLCRLHTSDRDVFRQIFVQREYRCLDHVRNASLIIDCGANCGYSAAYFLSRYPGAFLLAVEPDSRNVQALQDNLQPYAGRYRVIQSGVWSREAGLIVEDNSDFGDGREWARTVREARDGEVPDLQATDIGRLLSQSGHQRVSILKIDIEGSERMVFGEGALDWIEQVDNMVIELHGKECSDVVHAAMAGRGFTVSECEELTVFSRR